MSAEHEKALFEKAQAHYEELRLKILAGLWDRNLGFGVIRIEPRPALEGDDKCILLDNKNVWWSGSGQCGFPLDDDELGTVVKAYKEEFGDNRPTEKVLADVLKLMQELEQRLVKFSDGMSINFPNFGKTR